MEKKPLKFIHITKCAGTTIEELGILHGIKWGRYHICEYGFWHEPFPVKNPSLKGKYDWFMVVRNPYERLVSEFYCKWGGLGNKQSIDFNERQFNDFIEEKITNMSLQKKSGHYIPQYKYLDKNQTIHIIHYENIEKEFNELMKNYSYELRWIPNYRQNKPRHKKVFTVKSFSPRLIELINNIYSADFENFGYKKIYISEKCRSRGPHTQPLTQRRGLRATALSLRGTAGGLSDKEKKVW